MIKLLLKINIALLCILSFSAPTYSQYADLGTGNLKNQIWWFNWSGFTMANGASKSFTTATGLTVTLRFTNLNGPALSPSIMNTWYGAVLHLLYDFTNTSIMPAFYNTSNSPINTQFTLTVTATRNGLQVPVNFIVADAEASAVTEITTLTTNGSNWNTIDFFRNSSQTSNPLTGCNTQTVKISDTYGGSVQLGQNPVISTTSTSTGPLIINTTLDHGNISGSMGLAFGVMEAVDRGDLPPSYGFAEHALKYTINSPCSYSAPFPSLTQDQSLKLGVLPGDADGQQTLDDNAQGADEDAITTFPDYTGNGTYSISVPVTNTTGAMAYLVGWFDINNDGHFDPVGEGNMALVPPNATMANVTWSLGTLNLSKTTKYAFRFSLFSDYSLANTSAGYASDGEVEDYYTLIPQPVTAGFSAPDTVCVNTPVTITNTTVGATNYYWNFCVANSTTNPVGTNLGNFGFTLPVFMDYAKDGNNYYGFITNNMPGKLIRLNFGSSLLNTPTYTDFGNLGGIIPDQCEGIQLIYNESKWYVIAVGGQPVGRIVKVEFGSSLSNSSPIASNWGNIGNLAYPTDLHVFQDGPNWYGLTINAQTNSITRFNFSNSFNNTPTGTNLGNIGSLDYPTGIYAVSNNGVWHAFISNAGAASGFNSPTSSLSRLDFGSSLLNTPTGFNLGNPGSMFKSARDLTIYKSCNEIFGFAVNNSTANDIIRLNFNNDLTSIPTAISLGNTGNLNFPHSISKLFRVGSDLYSFIANVTSNTLTRLKFSGCNNASISSSVLQNPAPITYDTPGIYSINLTIDDGLPSQSSFCKQIVVMPNPVHSPTQTISICSGSSIKIGSSVKPGNYLWNTGLITDSIVVSSPGIYWVESNRFGCSVRDSFIVSLFVNPAIDFGFQQNYCAPKNIQFATSLNTPASFQWSFGNGQTNSLSQAPSCTYLNYGTYNVLLKVHYTNGCSDSLQKTITFVNTYDSSLIVNQDTTICVGDSVLLNLNKAAVMSCLNSQGGNVSSLTYVKPIATSTYTVSSGVVGVNLIRNADFSSGNVNFISDYNYTLSSSANGQYWVGSNPGSWNGSYTSCTDHTSSTGNMMIVKNNSTPVANVWSQTVAVSPNTNYVFSTWVEPLSNSGPSILQFAINQARLGNTIVSGTQICDWKQFTTTWNSGTNTSATLSIITSNASQTLTDFAIDDLFFGTVLTQTDSVTIHVGSPCDSIKITGQDKICSPADTITYSIWKPIGCTEQYSVQVDANFVDIISATPSYLSLKFKQNGNTKIKVALSDKCKIVADSFDVAVRFSPTSVNLGPDISSCRDTSLILHAGSGYSSYVWQDGSIDSILLVSAVGTYSVVTQNFCGKQFNDSVKVIRTIPYPFAVKPLNAVVCAGDSVQFFASGGTVYTWTPATNFANPARASSKAVVNISEDFTLYIADTVCQRDTLITIPVTASGAPSVNISKSNDVNCSNDSATLVAVGGINYSWSPNTYITRIGNNQITVKPPTTTTYYITAKDAIGCIGKDSIVVYFSKVGEQKLYVPSGFTPNGDGKNDVFKPVMIGQSSKYDFRIYNRWGQLVFRTANPDIGWDGKYGAVLQPGDVYVYYIIAEGSCDGIFERKGTFVLIR